MISVIMKRAVYATFAAVLLTSTTGWPTQGMAAGATGTSAMVRVQYVNPQSFTDFSIHRRDIGYSASLFTKEITRTLEPVMNSRFPGNVLTLQFTNIDLAGSGTAGSRSVQVVRAHTPARVSFNYQLQGQSGRSIAKGSQTLVNDVTFGSSASAPRSGPVSAEARMLQRWLKGLRVTG
jgi:hypothetical protein